MATQDQILHFEDDAPPGADPWVVRPQPGLIEVVEYDPLWPSQAQEISDLLSTALGLRALHVEHIGSTAVAGLPAKPIIDLDVTVADPANEAGWLPQLERAGFVLTIREPWWYEHRMLCGGRGADDKISGAVGLPTSNVHIFGPDSPELIRHVVFRNWLRANREDRELYAAAKREAAMTLRANNALVMEYNARKQTVIREIFGRAFRAAGFLG